MNGTEYLPYASTKDVAEATPVPTQRLGNTQAASALSRTGEAAATVSSRGVDKDYQYAPAGYDVYDVLPGET